MEQTPHIAFLPSPGMGHFIPMIEFAKRLVLQHNISATFIIPDSSHRHFNKQKTFLESLPQGMNYIFLPPPNFNHFEANLKFEVKLVITIARSLPSIRDVLKSLVETKTLAALVVDLFGTHAFDMAKEFGVKPYMFFPSPAIALSLFLYLPKIDGEVTSEYKDLPEPVQIPGCIPLHGRDFPEPIQDRQQISYQLFLNDVKRYRMAEGIILNSFEEMEGEAIRALHEKVFQNPPVYPVGPMIQTNSHTHTNSEQAGSPRNAVEDSSVRLLKWLDNQPRESILFICFGSLKSVSHAQLHELAIGIEMSNKGFVWVVPTSPNDDHPPLAFLPEGFAERTKGRGVLVSQWAPQAKVLSHGSTGGFLTHCGWNSVLESVVNGVPMIAWPLGAEQKMIAVLLSEDLKVAIRPKVNVNDEEGFVGRVAIANVVKNLMYEGEERELICERMRELKDAAAKVGGDDGSSTKSIANLVSKWKKN